MFNNFFSTDSDSDSDWNWDLDSSAEMYAATFTKIVKIEWSEFDKLASTKEDIRRDVITPYENVPLFWRIAFKTTAANTTKSNFGCFANYLDGPMSRLDDVQFDAALMRPDGSRVERCSDSMIERFVSQGRDFGFHNFGCRDSKAFQVKYGAKNSKPLEFMFTLKIPVSTFSWMPFVPKIPKLRGDISFNAFRDIEDPKKSPYWKDVFISKERKRFYVHEFVIGTRSAPLAAMLRHPPAKGEKKDEHRFQIGNDAMKAFLEFIYTDQTNTEVLTTATIIELVHAAEQYDFMDLKELCACSLWKRIPGKPEDCFDIIRFADLLDMKHLKYRSMDVLFTSPDLPKSRFGTDAQGKRLRSEYGRYVHKRLEASLGPLED